MRIEKHEASMPHQWNYDLCGNKFLERRIANSVRYGTESISLLAAKVLQILPDEIRFSSFFKFLKKKNGF